MNAPLQTTSRIRELNDMFRTCFIGGRVLITEGITDLGDSFTSSCAEAVQRFTDFSTDNDPYGEHDFGSFIHPSGGKVFWKIDYYDLDLKSGSEDPADPAKTKRVLTVMLASEY